MSQGLLGRAALGVLLAALLVMGLTARLGAFMVAWVPPAGDATATAPTPGTTPFGERGPYPIGVRRLATDGASPLGLTFWYPATRPGPAGEEPAIAYPYRIKMFGPGQGATIATFGGSAARNAPYARTTGPYPLVILSPGYAIGATTYAWLSEHLASHGLAVVAPDHAEELDPSLLWRATVARPQDIRTVLGYVDEQTRAGDLQGVIDPERLALVGHSYGGYTALVAAGARLDSAGFAAVCGRAHETDDPVVFLCDALLPHMAEMAELAGLASVPPGLWPDWADPRVDAVVSLAGDAVVFGPVGLAALSAPVMAIGGTRHTDSPYAWSTRLAYEAGSSPRKVEIALHNAGHMVFTGPCEATRRLLTIWPQPFCSDPGWEKTRAHALVRRFATAFLLAELLDDPVARAALASDDVDVPGVTYRARGY